MNSRAWEGRRKEFHGDGEKIIDSRIFGNDDFVTTVLAEAEALPLQKPDVEAVVAAVKKLCALSDERLTALCRDRVTLETKWISSGKNSDPS